MLCSFVVRDVQYGFVHAIFSQLAQFQPRGGLELESQASEGGGAGHRDEADLVVAVVIWVTSGSIDRGIYPTGGGDVGVEDVVDIEAEGDFPQEATEFDRIAETYA